MTNVEKRELIVKLKNARPFKPFAIVSSDGTRAVIEDPLRCGAAYSEVLLEHPQTKKIWHLPMDQATVIENPTVTAR
ncbi:MAG TPA: hypothetical protein VF624_09455 [Tepidisphaeraceae bacterium]|jgi:hypothetical protein